MLDVDAQITVVPPRQQRAALAFIAGGREGGGVAEPRLDLLRRLVEGRSGRLWLWWDRNSGRCRSAALVLAGVGRTGRLYYSPPAAEGVQEASLQALLAAIARTALVEGPLSLVQASCGIEDRRDIALLERAGFSRLAELITMRRDLSTPPEDLDDPAIVWRRYGQFTQDQLAQVIRASYEQSLDCPPLRGRRQIADVIAGHKASGAFSPKSWWIAFVAGRPAACVLVNASSNGASADIVYLGVAGNARGRGLGRKLLARSSAQAYESGYKSLTLAVDADNTFALRLYLEAGFREQYRRATYTVFAESSTVADRSSK